MNLRDRPRSLTDDLRSRSDAELGELLRERQDLVRGQPSDMGQLASLATSDRSVALAMESLDRLEMQVVEVVAAAPGASTREQVCAAFGSVVDWAGLQSSILAALDRLWIMALVWGTYDEFTPVGVLRKLVGPYPCGLAPASMTGHRPIVRRYSTDPAYLDSVLAAAPGEAVEALRRLAFTGPAGHLESADRPVSVESARTPMEWLLARDLVVPSGPTAVVIPREVALHLRGGVYFQDPAYPPPDASGDKIRDPDVIDRTAGQSALEAVEAVREILDAWSTDPPTVLRKGGLAVRDLSAVARMLDVDDSHAALLVEIVQAAGLLVDDREAEPHWVPTTAYDAWLAEKPEQQWAAIVRAWLRMLSEPGFMEVSDDAGQRPNALSPALVMREASLVRRAAVDVLASLPAGVTPTMHGVRAGIRHRCPRMADDLVEFVSVTAIRQAEILGLTGLGAMSTAGRDLLGGMTAWPRMPEPIDTLMLQGDLTAVAPGPLRRDIAREMGLVADIESKGAAKVYRFTPESIRRALDAGRDAGSILGFLRSVSRTDVPQPLSYLVEDEARRHGSLRIGSASSYVRSDDAAALAAALSDQRANSLGLRRISPTVLISSSRVSVLLTTLRAMGLGPVAESGDGGVVVQRVRVQRAEPPRQVPVVIDEGGLIATDFDTLLGKTVRRLRSTQWSASRTTSVITAVISEAIDQSALVRITHVDGRGVMVSSTITPQRILGGKVVGVETATGSRRQFPLERITEAVLSERI